MVGQGSGVDGGNGGEGAVAGGKAARAAAKLSSVRVSK